MMCCWSGPFPAAASAGTSWNCCGRGGGIRNGTADEKGADSHLFFHSPLRPETDETGSVPGPNKNRSRERSGNDRSLPIIKGEHAGQSIEKRERGDHRCPFCRLSA